MKLSVVIPVYNERPYILRTLDRVRNVNLDGMEKEIVVVDDRSRDGTRELLRDIKQAQHNDGTLQVDDSNSSSDLAVENLEICMHQENRGKGAALRTGFERASGDVIVVQDADLEYDPSDFKKLLEPIRSGKADVVYGSRFLGGPHRVLFFWHYQGNRFLTLLSNMLTNLNLTDMETGYKMFRREVLKDLEIQQDRFGFEPEFTAKVARDGWRVYEVPISYFGRTYEEGKKITWVDGVKAVWCILRYNLF